MANMPLVAGQKLGPYEISAPLGAGGMGEVYRAKDTRLGREVAIKILSDEFSSNQNRMERFEQEARAASALNHPNIITVYDVGVQNGASYIAMELIDGKSLARIAASRRDAGQKSGKHRGSDRRWTCQSA